ncbi:MGMT family protein [Parendozoicomonas haliclonae]|uniref:Methylated-DNA-protein-cysteine methyltransferase n=1 Tax=Parendozoicomonas haliclonae TaxID=1960125 RepID=A0A1X7ADY0_9GAMM|nr:MGMT family protein [Parendozoicomonas haliclonae]SMA31870.1 Methylated-DNA-protein-cysteine methyltransferase [Parendozoicomonas haliclonae]
MSELTRNQKIWLVVSEIPEGKVATYGQIAELAGLPNAARLVGTVLSQLPPGSHLPWHRVINSRGEISFPQDSSRYSVQKERLEQEGIVFIESRLSLKEFRWDGVSI